MYSIQIVTNVIKVYQTYKEIQSSNATTNIFFTYFMYYQHSSVSYTDPDIF